MQYQSPHWSQVESRGGTTSTVLLRQHFFTLCAEIYTGSLRESIRSLVTYFKHHQSMESPMYQQSINSEIASYDELNPRSWELKSPCELLTTQRNCVTTVRSSHRPEPQNLLVQLMLWTLNKYWMNKWQETLRILKFIIRRCKYATQTSWRLDPDPDKMRSFFFTVQVVFLLSDVGTGQCCDNMKIFHLWFLYIKDEIFVLCAIKMLVKCCMDRQNQLLSGNKLKLFLWWLAL